MRLSQQARAALIGLIWPDPQRLTARALELGKECSDRSDIAAHLTIPEHDLRSSSNMSSSATELARVGCEGVPSAPSNSGLLSFHSSFCIPAHASCPGTRTCSPPLARPPLVLPALCTTASASSQTQSDFRRRPFPREPFSALPVIYPASGPALISDLSQLAALPP